MAEALPVLFGHIGEGNLHLNVLRCAAEREAALYAPMMDLIARLRRQRQLRTRRRQPQARRISQMSREPADIAAMRTVKAALDPTGYLNAAVMFD